MFPFEVGDFVTVTLPEGVEYDDYFTEATTPVLFDFIGSIFAIDGDKVSIEDADSVIYDSIPISWVELEMG